jgi:transposase
MANYSSLGKILRAQLLRQQGYSLREIAKMVGLHKDTVRAHVSKISRSKAMKLWHARKREL